MERLSAIDWYKKVVLQNYANFNGRARREEYWKFMLVHVIIQIIFAILCVIGLFSSDTLSSISSTISIIYGLATILPSVAVGVRRLHDTGQSGWMTLITVIPFVGFYLLYLMVKEGDKGSNQYGPDPKGNMEEIEKIGL